MTLKTLIFFGFISSVFPASILAGKIEVVDPAGKITFYTGNRTLHTISPALKCSGYDETSNRNIRIVGISCISNGMEFSTNDNCDGNIGAVILSIKLKNGIDKFSVTHHCNGETIK